MDYKRIVKELISEYNIDSETDRKKAYVKCIDYGNINFKEPKDFNGFINEAAKILNQIPVYQNIVSEEDWASGDEKLHLKYSKEFGPVLTGNKAGLSYLSKMIAKLSDSERSGEHIHLYNDEFPMYGKSYALTIYLENDEWFPKYGIETPEAENAPVKREKRDIDTNKIIGFVIFDYIPPTLPLTTGKIYKVKSCVKFENQKIWVKNFYDNSDRLYVFDLVNDDKENFQYAMDLDDKTVLYLTEKDIKNLTE
ncbi:MAG: hypothetical protein ABFD79_00695 [Phycisphaerales bacterium]